MRFLLKLRKNDMSSEDSRIRANPTALAHATTQIIYFRTNFHAVLVKITTE
jgi:hypothetical protein